MPWTRLERYHDVGLLIIRLGFGLGFVWFHGLPKLTGGTERWAGTGGAMESLGITFGAEWWGLAAAVLETIGGLMIAFGLFFRPAALGIALVMVVATANHFVTGQGSPAHAFKNIWLFAGLVFVGPGRYSLDALLAERTERKETVQAARTSPRRVEALR